MKLHQHFHLVENLRKVQNEILKEYVLNKESYCSPANTNEAFTEDELNQRYSSFAKN